MSQEMVRLSGLSGLLEGCGSRLKPDTRQPLGVTARLLLRRSYASSPDVAMEFPGMTFLLPDDDVFRAVQHLPVRAPDFELSDLVRRVSVTLDLLGDKGYAFDTGVEHSLPELADRLSPGHEVALGGQQLGVFGVKGRDAWTVASACGGFPLLVGCLNVSADIVCGQRWRYAQQRDRSQSNRQPPSAFSVSHHVTPLLLGRIAYHPDGLLGAS
jgi:hypothetical protein